MKPMIYWVKGPWKGKLAIVARPRGNEWLEDEIKGLVDHRIDVIVSLLTNEENDELGLTSEAEVARQQGTAFTSFPIPDYGVPESHRSVLDLVRHLELLLSQGKSIAIHCRQGIGRSSVMAACLPSTSTCNVDDCFKQIREARGANVPDTDEQFQWVRSFAEKASADLVGQ